MLLYNAFKLGYNNADIALEIRRYTFHNKWFSKNSRNKVRNKVLLLDHYFYYVSIGNIVFNNEWCTRILGTKC